MTNIQTQAPTAPVISQTQASADDINGTQQYMAPLVWDLQALQLSTKQAHWHVRGDNFIAVHKLLDKVTDHVREFADMAAERTVALGLPVDARIETVAAKNTLPQMKDGFQNYGQTIEQVVAQMDAATATARKAIEGLDDIDLSSQDVAIAIEQGLVEDRWFLAAHLAVDN